MPTGAEILAAGSTWVEADTGVTAVDVSAPALRTGWGIVFGGTRAAVSNLAGPGGELGIRLTENGTTATGILAPLAAITNLGPGPVKFTSLCRYHDNATERTSLGALNAGRWRWPDMNASAFGSQLYAVEPARYAAEVTGPSSPVVGYAFTGINRYDSYTRTDRVDGWSEVEWEAYVVNKASLSGIGQCIRASSGSAVGNSLPVLDIAAFTIEQKRMSEWRDRRNNSLVYSQATNNSRLCKLGDFWLGSRPCITEGISTATGNVSITAAATPAVLMAMICPRFGAPDADSQVLAIGDTRLVADTDGQWHIVQGGTDVDSDYPVATVPICVALRDNGSTVDLWIDGTLIKNASIDIGSTGHAIGGGHAAIAIQSVWTNATALSDVDMAAAMLEFRRLAGLAPYLPLWIETGQSNENLSTSLIHSTGSGAKMRAGWAIKTATADPVAPAQRTDYSTLYYYGAPTGVIAAAQAAGEPGIVCHYALGGTAISHWLDGAAGQIAIAAQVSALLAAVGTPLARVEKFLFIQGEQDAGASSSEADYLAGLENILGWLLDDYGDHVRFYGLRLTEAYPTGTPANVRAAQDAFKAAHPARVGYVAVDPVWLGAGNIHYTEAGKWVIGDAVYSADLAPAEPVGLSGVNTASAPISPMPSGLSGANAASAPISPMPLGLAGLNEASDPEVGPMPNTYAAAPAARTVPAPAQGAPAGRIVRAGASGARAARLIP